MPAVSRRDSAPDGFADGVSAQRGELESPVAHKIAGSDFELPKADPKGVGQDARSLQALRSPVTEWALQFMHHQAITING